MSQAKERGIFFGNIHTLDATHTVADVDTAKDGYNQKHLGALPRDPDAAWGVKGDEKKMTTNGTVVDVLKTFFGYKSHLIAETTHGLLTGVHITAGNISDLDGGDWLVHRILLPTEIQDIHILLADKGYGCPVWINLLEKYTGIVTAFSLPKTLLTYGQHQDRWKQYYETDEHRKTLRKERSIIERINADLKDNHSLRHCRYLGKTKYTFQTIMASIAHNVKIIMKLTTGARLRPI